MRIYLDHQSATPLFENVLQEMQSICIHAFGNPSSVHSDGFFAREALNLARERFQTFLHASSPEEIIFTSNGTEAVNLAIKGTALANQRRGKHIIISAAEHPAINGSVAWLETLGFTVTTVPVDSQGTIDPSSIAAAFRPDTILVATHHANHDLGTIQPIEKIGELCAERGILFFVDAVASAGWLGIDVQAWQASLVAISPHRFYGPKGVGVLYRNRRTRLQSLIHGGMQEDGYRAGTENVPAIVGGGLAAAIALSELPRTKQITTELQERFWHSLSTRISRVRLNGPRLGPQRIGANLNLSFAGLEGEGLALALDLKGVAVAAGSACVTKEMRVPPILAAIGLDESWAKGTIIATLGRENIGEEIDQAAETFARVVANLRDLSPDWETNIEMPK